MPRTQDEPQTIGDIADEVSQLDRAAADTIDDDTEPLKEKNGFMRAPGVEKVVRRLIHEKLGHLVGEKVLCLHATKTTAATSPFKVKKIGLMHSAIASYSDLVEDSVVAGGEEFFVILVPLRIWEALGEKSKEALCYDALQHIGIDQANDRRYVRQPDFKGFYNTIAEYGLWQDSLQKLGDVAKPHIAQLPLLEVAS